VFSFKCVVMSLKRIANQVSQMTSRPAFNRRVIVVQVLQVLHFLFLVIVSEYNATGQCPIVCPSHVDNDGTVAHGQWPVAYRPPGIPSSVPSYRRFLNPPNSTCTIKL